MRWVYQLNRACVVRGDKVIFDDVTLSVPPGAKIGIVGPNGAGKSTLLRVVAGLERPSSGDARPAPGISVGFLPQEPVLADNRTVLENVRDGVTDIGALLARYTETTTRLAEYHSDELMNEIGWLQEQLDDRGGWELDARLEQAMDALRCPPSDTAARDLSGGERRRVALCTLLLQQPDLLLLDEPTNHLDAANVQWLEQHLADYPGTVAAVTHDHCFLDNVAQWILELDRGRAYPYQGNYTTHLDTKAARLQVEGRKDAKRLRRLLQELDGFGPGRKPGRPKALPGCAGMKKWRRRQSRPAVWISAKSTFRRSAAGHFGDRGRASTQVVRRPRTVSRFVFLVAAQRIIGVIGPNGVGKTTLFQMITGHEPADSGKIRIGDTVGIAYVDQNRANIDPDRTAWEVVSGGEDILHIGLVEVPSRAYVAAFGFKGPDQQKPARLFSGGERNRLNLALTLKQGGNMLLLDEPSNDLDTETLESLENAIIDFPGRIMLTAHDRWFLDRVATHVLAWEGTETVPAQWYCFEGNFGAYEQNKSGSPGMNVDHQGDRSCGSRSWMGPQVSMIRASAAWAEWKP